MRRRGSRFSSIEPRRRTCHLGPGGGRGRRWRRHQCGRLHPHIGGAARCHIGCERHRGGRDSSLERPCPRELPPPLPHRPRLHRRGRRFRPRSYLLTDAAQAPCANGRSRTLEFLNDKRPQTHDLQGYAVRSGFGARARHHDCEYRSHGDRGGEGRLEDPRGPFRDRAGHRTGSDAGRSCPGVPAPLR